MEGILNNSNYVTSLAAAIIAYGALTATVYNNHTNINVVKADSNKAIEAVLKAHNADISELKKVVKTLGEVQNRQIRTEVISEVTLAQLNKLSESFAVMSSKIDKQNGFIQAADDHIKVHK